MATLCFFETTPVEKTFLKKGPLGKHRLLLFPEAIQEVDPMRYKRADVLSVFVYSHVDKAVLARCRNVKLVATRSTGFDHIDVTACKKRRIPIATVPSYGENTVAEHTFALMLSLSRKVHQAYHRTIRGNFSFEGLQGFDLQGKTLGVVGTGHIGLHAIRIARGFGMRVVAFDVRKNEFMAETLGYQYVPFDTLLAEADIISLHAPYNTHTHHLINGENIAKIKRGALLVNTARGGLVETEALVRALDEGILAGAGLDVLEGEELIKEERQILSQNFSVDRLKTLLQNHILLNRENVVITPHIAFNSKEAFMRILETTVNNIQAFLSGKPENLVP